MKNIKIIVINVAENLDLYEQEVIKRHIKAL